MQEWLRVSGIRGVLAVSDVGFGSVKLIEAVGFLSKILGGKTGMHAIRVGMVRAF